MREHSEHQRKGKPGDGKKHLLTAAAIPLAVIILMIVIVIADRGNEKETAADTEAETVQETLLEPDTEQSSDLDAQESEEMEETGDSEGALQETEAAQLQKDSDPELLSLMKTYFEARAVGDAETMNRLYGIEGLSVTQLEAEKTRMRSNSKYLRGFENIQTYVKEGLTADSWLVYTTCDIRFHSVETAAPMIMWCYVVKDAEGTMKIQDQEALSAEVMQFIDVVNRSEEVRTLASDVNGRLKEALLSDENLNEVYGVLRDGSPVYQDAEETDAVQILNEEEEKEE